MLPVEKATRKFLQEAQRQDKTFPGDSTGKESICNAGDAGSIPGLGRSPGEGNGNPLQYSCLENAMDRRGWWAAVLHTSSVSDVYRGSSCVCFCLLYSLDLYNSSLREGRKVGAKVSR